FQAQEQALRHVRYQSAPPRLYGSFRGEVNDPRQWCCFSAFRRSAVPLVVSFFTASRYDADIVEKKWLERRPAATPTCFSPYIHGSVCDQGDPMENTNPQDLLSRMNQIQI